MKAVNPKKLPFTALCLLGTIGYAVVADATSINTELCDNVSGPVVNITTPLSDSVVNEPTIQLQGNAIRTTQIDISLNGSYSSSLAIGSSGQIDSSITVAKGTNTISLHAYYSCNQTDSTTAIVITYEPTASPSIGSTTNTTVSPTTLQPTHASSSAPTPTSQPEEETTFHDPAQPSDNQQIDQSGTTPDKEEVGNIKPANDSDGIHGTSVILATTALLAPSLLVVTLEQFGGIIGLEGYKLSMGLKWLLRSSGLLLAALVLAILYGVS